MVVNCDAFACSLLDSAVRAAVAAHAPRRTVAATAAAVAHAVMAAAKCADFVPGETAPDVAALRQKKKKKKRRRKATSATSVPDVATPNHTDTNLAESFPDAAVTVVSGEELDAPTTREDQKIMAALGLGPPPPATPISTPRSMMSDAVSFPKPQLDPTRTEMPAPSRLRTMDSARPPGQMSGGNRRSG